MTAFYDRAGNPITLEEWARLHDDLAYLRVADDIVGSDGGAPWWLSTVWLGIDHGFGRTARPVIFETILFDPEGEAHECWRWTTEAEARDFHAIILDDLADADHAE